MGPASSAASSEELQRPAPGGDQKSERGRVLPAAVVPGEAPTAEAAHAEAEAEAGEQESPGEEEQPAGDSPLVAWRTRRDWGRRIHPPSKGSKTDSRF